MPATPARLRASACAALIAAATGAAAAAPPTIEGTWRLATPATALTPVGGAIPFTAEGRSRYEANRAARARGDFDSYDITTSRCSTPGVPRMMLMPMRFRIWNQLGIVTFDFEWNRAIRQVDVRGVPTEAPLVPDKNGTSKGRWEGGTLVAVTTDEADRTLLDALVPHTDDARITERLRLRDAATLEDRITIEDAALFTRPWEAVLTFRRQPDAIFAEDVCLDRRDAAKGARAAS